MRQGVPGRLSSGNLLVTTLGSSKRHALLRLLGVLSRSASPGRPLAFSSGGVAGTETAQLEAPVSPQLQPDPDACNSSLDKKGPRQRHTP